MSTITLIDRITFVCLHISARASFVIRSRDEFQNAENEAQVEETKLLRL